MNYVKPISFLKKFLTNGFILIRKSLTILMLVFVIF